MQDPRVVGQAGPLQTPGETLSRVQDLGSQDSLRGTFSGKPPPVLLNRENFEKITF